MEKPQQPYMEYLPPYTEYVDKTVFEQVYLHPDIEEEDFKYRYEDEDLPVPPIESWWYDTNITLSFVLSKLPPNTNFEDVSININRDRQIDHIVFQILVKEKSDKKEWLKKKKQAQKEYDTKLAEYNKQKQEYDIWEAEQQILNATQKLQQLKSK